MSLLDITESAVPDDRIIRREYISHKPYASTTYNKNDEIRIVIQHQDAITQPCESFLFLDISFTKAVRGENVSDGVNLTRNALAFLFQEMRYELNGMEIDRTRNVGITSTLKTYVSASPTDLNALENSYWFIDEPTGRAAADYARFTVCIPLKLLMGYFEDMQRIIMNAKQELILVRSGTDKNSYIQAAAEDDVITINSLIWKMPHITVSDEERLKLLKVMNTGAFLPLNFRSWELIEYPLLPVTSRQTWAIKTSIQLETPRFIILAFQTNRRGVATNDSSVFDHCNLTNAKVFLNSEFYPYDNLQLDWGNNMFSLAYDMYSRFRKSYYEDAPEESDGCLLSPRKYKELAPIIVIDCSKQNEVIKSGSIDVRIEWESSANFPAQTSAYALVLHDRVISYSPLTGLVQRSV